MDPNQTSNQMNNPMMNAPMGNQMPERPPVSLEHRNAMGTWVAAVVIVLALAVGGFYFWSQKDVAPVDTGTDNTQLQAITTQGSADDAAAIKADLNATKVDNLDSQLNAS